MPKKKESENIVLLDTLPSLDDRLAKLKKAAQTLTNRWNLPDAVAIPGKDPEQFTKRVYSTGLLSIDNATRLGGFPRGHIIELYGSPSGGKSLLVYNVIREVQKKDGLFVLFDQENSFDPVWATRQGIDLNKLIVMKLPIGEQAIDMVRMIMNQHKPDAMAIDSIAQLQPATEQNRSAVDDATMMGIHAKIMSQLCRHITSSFLEDPKNAPLFMWVNQMRADVSGYGADKVTGGYAPEFYSSIRIKMLRQKAVNQKDISQGFTGTATFKKCKAAEGVTGRAVKYVLLPSGFDFATDTYETAVSTGVFSSQPLQTGSHYWSEDTEKAHKIASSRAAAIDLISTDVGFSNEVRERVLALMNRGTTSEIYLGDGIESPEEA